MSAIGRPCTILGPSRQIVSIAPRQLTPSLHMPCELTMRTQRLHLHRPRLAIQLAVDKHTAGADVFGLDGHQIIFLQIRALGEQAIGLAQACAD